jgi:SAM-dependent methyltransferase
MPAATPLLDIGCGAGSVLRQAAAGGLTDLYGLDTVDDLAGVLLAQLPGVRFEHGDAADLPYEDGSFGAVVSQFGIEYAELRAFSEATRVLRPGGALVMVLHHAEGAIAAETRGHKAVADRIAETGFADSARALTEAVFAAPREASPAIAPAMARYAEADRALVGLLQATPHPLALHLYQGFRQLYERRAAYALTDITGWLDGMKAEIDAYRARLGDMLAAARDEDDMAEIRRLLSDGGVETTLETLTLDADAGVAAWILRGRKA